MLYYNAPRTTSSSTLSLHDALPIYVRDPSRMAERGRVALLDGAHGGLHEPFEQPLDLAIQLAVLDRAAVRRVRASRRDRKSTRLNSSHRQKSYAVFCLKKKKNEESK